jgi:beta-glucosidase
VSDHNPVLLSLELTPSNLEWIFGYGPRFGITVVDRDDGCKRYPKDSAKVLKEIFAHLMEKK